MKNVLRTLIYNESVSLTLLDATETVNEAIRLHGLSRASAVVFGKALAVMTYVASCLKEETGEVSVSIKGSRAADKISVSGNYALNIRGCIDNPIADAEPGDGADSFLGDGTLTMIRDDGYSRPFVGACAIPCGSGIDEAFEEYYRISEQLPTRIASVVRLDERGGCAFAGAAVLQPLPFADEELLKRLPVGEELKGVARAISELGLEKCAEAYFSAKSEDFSLREAAYKCNCSREYLSGVLVSLGRGQLVDVLRSEGEIKVHCHYCNKDYRFTREDIDGLFP